MVGGRTVAAVQVGENLSNQTVVSRLDRQAVFGHFIPDISSAKQLGK